MRSTGSGWWAAATVTALLLGGTLSSPIALADPSPDPATEEAPPVEVPTPEAAPEFGPGPHNVVYRARVDGVSRGATITYKIADDQVNSAVPTMVPGRTFEATGVVDDPKTAGMSIAIQWPYSASLYCEILVDDQVTAEASQFVAPRFTPQREDPGYGVLNCGGPVANAAGSVDTGVLVDPAPPPAPEPAPPAE